MAAAGFIFGLNNQTPYTLGNGHAGIGAIPYEEQSAGTGGSGVGWGQRLASRDYSNHPSEAFTTGSEVAQWNGGRQVLMSVSNGYSAASIAAGTHDAEWNAMWDRLFALPFGATDTSGAGTKKPLDVWFCYEHEVDRPDKNVPPADYVAAWKHIRVLRNNRAAAAGQDPSRVKMMTVFTAYGINVGRTAPYWPGNDQVDYFGIDSYNQLFGRGNWTNLSTNIAKGLTFNTAHGNKKVVIAETSTTIGSGTQSATQYWANAATFCNAHPEIIAVFGFQGAPGGACNTDKVGAALTHEAMRQFIISTGGTAGYGAAAGGGGGGGVQQLAPSSPTGLAFTSDPSGTFGTLTWAANPSGDNVTLWDAYQAAGKVTSGFKKINATSLPASPRSLLVTGLSPGSSYSFTLVAINSADRSGFGSMLQTQTAKPGPTNQAPTIVNFSADVDDADSTLVHFTSAATDPNGDALTYTISVTGPAGFTDTQSGPNVDAHYTPGSYQAALAVGDGTLVTTQVVAFHIADGPTSTPDSHYELPQPGDDLRAVTRIYRQTIPDIDARLTRARKSRSPHNAVHGFVASTFDPAMASGSKSAITAGDVRWYWMKLESNTIAGLATYVSDVQTGSGAVFCVHASDGSQLCGAQSGTVVDAAFQTVGDTEIDLDQPIADLTAGDLVAVGLFFPSGVTPPKTYVAPGANPMSQLRLSQGFWRGNSLAGQSAYPDVLPFTSATAVTPAFFALY